MRHLPHSHAVSRDASFSADGTRAAFASPQLEQVRHRARGLPAKAYVSRSTSGWVRLGLSNSFFAPVHLAPPATAGERGPAVPCDVLSLQEIQSLLAFPHKA